MRGARARSALAGTRFADVRWVAETGSTNADALDLARRGAPDGVVVVADHQRAGRGRLDRTWEAAPGQALLTSVLVRPGRAPGSPPPHRLVAALAVAAAEACEARAPGGPPVALKWPNDLVVVGGPGAGKLGGILAESLVEGGEVTAVVVGLGLNLAWPLAVDPGVAAAATSLARLAALPAGPASTGGSRARGRPWRSPPSPTPGPGRADGPGGAGGAAGADETAGPGGAGGPVVPAAGGVDPEEVLVDLLARFERWGGAAAGAELAAEQRRRSATLGRRVRVEEAGGAFEGDAVDLTPDGLLVVEVGGRRREVAVGDIVHLWPLP